MKKWLWYSTFLHLFLLLWITSFCSPPGAEVHQAKMQQRLERKQAHFTRRNLNRLHAKVEKMQDMKNEMIHLRNKRLRQLEQFEQEMRDSFSQKQQKTIEDARQIQQSVHTGTGNTLTEIRKMMQIQQEMAHYIEQNQFYDAMRKSGDVANQMTKTGYAHAEAVKNSEQTLEALQKYEQLLSWLNNESSFNEISRIRRQQQSINKEMDDWQHQFKKYSRNLMKKSLEFERDAYQWKNPADQPNWKQWSKKRELNQFVKPEDYEQRLEAVLKKQEEITRDFEKLAQIQSDSVQTEDFKFAGLDELPMDSTRITPNADLEALYYESKELEYDINELFRQTRAAELSMILNLPYEKSYAKIPGSSPKYADIDKKLHDRNIQNQKDLNKYQRAFENVAQNINATYAAASAQRDQLAKTNTSLSEQGASSGLAQAQEMQKRINQLKYNAGFGDGHARDLSVSMKNIMAPIVVAENKNYPETRRQNFDNQNQLNQSLTFFRDTAGRKITANGRPATWFYINSWYLIGPFPNPGRQNIEKKFPPEFGIDLDAVYPGKHGLTLQWQYISAPSHSIIPVRMEQYAIYYAFTEFYCEIALDLWIAVGSDDRSDVWINDLPVWSSSNALKQCQINEGFRKVHFKQGYNKILLRLENAWRECGFSFLVCAQPDISISKLF